MALTDETNMVMPVSPMYGGGNNGGFGGFGGDSWGWLILLLLIANGGWGNGFGFGGGIGSEIYPWMNQANLTSNGFQNQMLNDNVTSIRDGIANLSTQLCGCCGDMQMALANGFANVEQGANARQMANMQTAFAGQTAMSQGFSNLASQFADCCCENRLASCQTQNIIQNEGNATRFADANNTRDIIESQTRGTQTIIDKLCELELNAKNDRISDLERQLTMANLSASQTAQTAQLLADNNRQTVALEQYLNPVPVPAYVVANPNCCQQNSCGCGCGNF